MNYYPLRATGYLPETLILANGSFPKHPLLLDWLKRCDYIVCCDGAADDLLQRGIKPVAIVGDCDSLSASSRTEFAAILHPCSDQETNDLTKSVRFCLDQGRRNLTIIGATGKEKTIPSEISVCFSIIWQMPRLKCLPIMVCLLPFVPKAPSKVLPDNRSLCLLWMPANLQ